MHDHEPFHADPATGSLPSDSYTEDAVLYRFEAQAWLELVAADVAVSGTSALARKPTYVTQYENTLAYLLAIKGPHTLPLFSATPGSLIPQGDPTIAAHSYTQFYDTPDATLYAGKSDPASRSSASTLLLRRLTAAGVTNPTPGAFSLALAHALDEGRLPVTSAEIDAALTQGLGLALL